MRTRTVDEQKHERLCLDAIKLLSALESWGMINSQRLPDYLVERICDVIDRLEGELLK